MTTPQREPLATVLKRALTAPDDLLGDTIRGRLAFRFSDTWEVRNGPRRSLYATVQPVEIRPSGTERRIAGRHSIGLWRANDGGLEAAVYEMTVKEPLGSGLVAHALGSLRAQGVRSVRLDAKPAGLGTWADVMEACATQTDGADVLAAIRAGSERWLAGRGSPEIVDDFLRQVNSCVLRVSGTGLTRSGKEIAFQPGGGRLEHRFADELNAKMTPGRLGALGPDVQGGPFGSWILDNSGVKWERTLRLDDESWLGATDLAYGLHAQGMEPSIADRIDGLRPSQGPDFDPIGA